MDTRFEPSEQITMSQEKSVLDRIIGVFINPSETFKSVGRKPAWVVPFIIVLVISLALSFFTIPIAIKESQNDPKMLERMDNARQRMADRGMSEQQIDDAFEKQQKIGQSVGPFSAVIVTGVLIFAISGILLLISNIGLGGKTNYFAMVSMYTYSIFIVLLGALIKLPLMIKQQSMKVYFSLATFLSPEASDTFLYRFLNKFALFEIWQLIVVIIGVAVINKFSTQKAAIPIVILWLLYIVAVSALNLPF